MRTRLSGYTAGMAIRADAADNERRIVAAAIGLGPAAAFYEVGRAAGVGQGTLYRRFAGPTALTRRVIRTIFDEPVEGETLFDQIEAVARRLVRVRPWADRLTEEEDRGWYRSAVDELVGLLEPEWRKAQAFGIVERALTLGDLRLAVGMVAGSDHTSGAVDLLRRGIEPKRGPRRPRPSAIERTSRIVTSPDEAQSAAAPSPVRPKKPRGRPLPSQRR